MPDAQSAREIGNHIEEQTEDYHREGMIPWQPHRKRYARWGSAADRQGIEPDPQAEVSDSVVWHHGDTDTGGNCHAGNLVFPYGDGGSGKLSA